jgi:hypothetical protein
MRVVLEKWPGNPYGPVTHKLRYRDYYQFGAINVDIKVQVLLIYLIPTHPINSINLLNIHQYILLLSQ